MSAQPAGIVHSSSQAIDPNLSIASVALAVGDLQRSTDFYARVLGLPLISHEPRRALLGLDREHPALELTGLDRPALAPSPGSTGRFHVAWLHPTRAGLAACVLRVTASRWPLDGASDHGVSEAIYLSDPDGLGIEIYTDRPRESWRRGPDGHGVVMYTAPLDLDDLLAQAPGGQTSAVEDGTTIGHVHLKVSDVARAVGFYRDALGFEVQASIPSAGFLSAGAYHHHIGLNSWQSQGGSPAPQDAPGLRSVEFQLSGPAAVTALAHRLGETPVQSDDEDRLRLCDPDSVQLSFAARS
jgi:catechol 2,3-dioxygenase